MAACGENVCPDDARNWPRLRLHFSTVLLLLFAALALAGVNLSSFAGVDPLEQRVLRYGWPATCFTRTADASLLSFLPGDAWPRSTISFGALAFDLLLAFALLAALAVASERRRRWRHVLQFSLSELLIFTLLLGGLCSWAFHDYRRQQVALDQLATLDGGIGVDQALPEWLWRQLPYLPGGRLKPLDKIVSVTLLNVFPKDLEQLDALSGLTHLKRLEFHNEIDGGHGPVGVSPDDRQLRLVSQLNQLEKLRLCGERISDAGLSSLERLSRLRDLELSCPNVTDAGLAHVAQLDRLERLQIWQGRISQSGLALLARLPRLKSLHLGLYNSLGSQLLASLKQLPALKSLKLSNAEFGDAELTELGGLDRLEQLSLVQSRVGGDGLARLAGLRRLQSLCILSSSVTDESLDALADFRRLKHLSLLWTPISDAGVARLSKASQLERLEINESASWRPHGGVSRNGVNQLRRSLPACEIAFYEFKLP